MKYLTIIFYLLSLIFINWRYVEIIFLIHKFCETFSKSVLRGLMISLLILLFEWRQMIIILVIYAMVDIYEIVKKKYALFYGLLPHDRINRMLLKYDRICNTPIISKIMTFISKIECRICKILSFNKLMINEHTQQNDIMSQKINEKTNEISSLTLTSQQICETTPITSDIKLTNEQITNTSENDDDKKTQISKELDTLLIDGTLTDQEQLKMDDDTLKTEISKLDSLTNNLKQVMELGDMFGVDMNNDLVTKLLKEFDIKKNEKKYRLKKYRLKK